MKTRFLVIAVLFLNLLSGCQSLPVQDAPQQPAVKITEGAQEIKIGNKICPVCGEEIEEGAEVTYEFEGKIYNFCCEDCIEEFKKDPKKYIEAVEKELKAEAEQKFRQQKEEMMKLPEPVSSYHEEHLTN